MCADKNIKATVSYTTTNEECGAIEYTTLFLIIGYKIIFLPNLFQSDI